MKKIYVAIKYSGAEELSYKKSLEACAFILKDGNIPISPIVMFHELAHSYDLPGDFAYWRNINFSLIDSCDEVMVVYGEGLDFKSSTGVVAEMYYAAELGKEVSYLYL